MTNEVSAKSTPSRRDWSAMHNAALETLSAVPRSMRFHFRYAGIVGRWIAPGPNTSGRLCRDERAHDRAHPTDADTGLRLVCADQDHQRELALADPVGGNERQPVAGRAEDDVERAVLHQRLDQRRRIAAHLLGGEAALQHRLAVVEHADVERDRPRIDSGDTRAAMDRSIRIDAGDSCQTSSLAIS